MLAMDAIGNRMSDSMDAMNAINNQYLGKVGEYSYMS